MHLLVLALLPKFCHITIVLTKLHWLPIDLRIEFKILTVTHHSARDLRSSKENLLAVLAF